MGAENAASAGAVEAKPSILLYGREELLQLRPHDVSLPRTLRKVIFSLKIWLPKHAATPHVYKHPSTVASTNRCANVIKVRIQRHVSPVFFPIKIGFMNVQSANDKSDDILSLRRDRGIDVLLLCETWHDSDSVFIRRLRSDGMRVIERARHRLRADMRTNHGGVVIAASNSIRLQPINVGGPRTTFEHVCGRVSSRGQSCVILVAYRPGSAAVCNTFFDELSDILSHLATFDSPVIVAGDFNIHLQRADDPHSHRFVDTLAMYGLQSRVQSVTHDRGGWLDVVATRIDLPAPSVDVLDPGFSDHRLLQWTSHLHLPAPSYRQVTSRPWRNIDIVSFNTMLNQSSITAIYDGGVDNADTMANVYNCELKSIADVVAPERLLTIRRRRSDPWYDAECAKSKCRCRQLERQARRSAASEDIKLAWKAQQREYRSLLSRKRTSFWSETIDSLQCNPRRMWRVIDDLFGRSDCASRTTQLTADDFSRFFDTKVAGVRDSTASAPPPTFTVCPPSCRLDALRTVTEADVVSLINTLNNKQCDLDPIPTRLLKDYAASLAPLVTRLLNASLSSGHVPDALKSAYVVPRLKKPDVDIEDVKNYRPISNLPVLSKLLERVVAKQLVDYLNLCGLMPRLQSAYRAAHSTETALTKITSQILAALDNGDLTALALLDLSAAFDTVDHQILLQRLNVSFGVRGVALDWFRSYLVGRKQYVKYGGRCSSTTTLQYGVPQGSILGPILFILYTADLVGLIEDHGLSPHLYADDTQILGSCRPSDTAVLRRSMEVCFADVASWMSANRLQLNATKTEIIWNSSLRRTNQVPSNSFDLGSDTVYPVKSVRDLGLYLDTTMSMRDHITRLTALCFGVLRQIRCVRRCLSSQARKSLVTCFIFARLDYCNAMFAGLPRCDVDRLQAVQNAAVRLIAGARRYDHVTPLLRDSHWLPVAQRIQFKLAIMVFKCLNNTTPEYLRNLLMPAASASSSEMRLRSGDSLVLFVPRTNSKTGDRSFVVAGPRTWNSLPHHIRACTSLAIFKKQLKTHLFKIAFN